MKRFWLCCSGFFAITVLHAQIDITLSGGSFTNAPLAGSNKSWFNVDSVGDTDNKYAKFGNLSNPAGTHTDYLVITNFGFNLPPDATINAIIVEIERSDASHRTSDYAINIVKGGVISTTNRSSGAPYSGSDSYQTFGVPGDFWGETWTPSDINDPNFGVAIAAQRNIASGITAGKIDHVLITVIYNLIVTPLKLISFTGSRKANVVELKWVTDAEINMDHYEIERSSNGRDFTIIGTVSSHNQPSLFNYTYADKSPLNGISYYRLKMLGTAPGDIGYSNIVSIDFNNDSRIILYPNPLRYGRDLTIDNPSGQRLNIHFYNMSGQMVANVITTSTHVPSSALFIQRGILPYKIYDQNGKLSATGKLLIE